ncbi:hypothetical protein QMT27_21010, partial [Cronobacter dublinensis]|uniref:hypothetical protein n=1 Tax=Cronobacter dublinensis TaxID=413497 RepID=UPI003ADC030D
PPWFSSLTSSPAALRVKMSTASHTGSRSSSSALRHSARVAVLLQATHIFALAWKSMGSLNNQTVKKAPVRIIKGLVLNLFLL